LTATVDQTEDYVVCLSDEAMARYSAEAAHSTRTARRHETFVKLAAVVVVVVILLERLPWKG
jgi:hypothetical protein